MEIFNEPTNRRLVIGPATDSSRIWDDLPAPAGTTARGTVVGYLEQPPHSYENSRLTIKLIERRCNTTAGSSYTRQILAGSFVPYGDNHELFEHNSSSPDYLRKHLWCSKCYADSPVCDGTGGVKIPEAWKGRYFAGVPRCTTCHAALYFWGVPLAREIGSAYVWETINDLALQKWIEEQLAAHGIFAVSASRPPGSEPGPAATADFRDELLATALSPERVGHLEATHGRAAVRELFGY